VHVSEHHDIKVYKRSEDKAPCILNFDTRWKRMVGFTTSERASIRNEAGGCQNMCGRGSKGKIPFPRLELNPGHPDHRMHSLSNTVLP
jgi:hypothetical protein